MNTQKITEENDLKLIVFDLEEEKIESYRQAIRQLLNQCASYQSPYGTVENQVVFDLEDYGVGSEKI